MSDHSSDDETVMPTREETERVTLAALVQQQNNLSESLQELSVMFKAALDKWA
jgi:hypothetical protein